MWDVLRKMEKRGVLDKLKKTRQVCRQIFTYATISDRAETNPVTDLAGALIAPKKQRFPHRFAGELNSFLNALSGYSGG
ncbi:hypothetical protein DDT52_12775 [Brenneria roseae subsp. roseae]|nr:hypothetical protein DDT52_12775 [Brenneria roseae subsp. roseae]